MSKVYSKYVDLIKKGKFTERELISFRRQINGSSKLDIDSRQELVDLFEEKASSNKTIQLSKEQQSKGLNWLRQKTFKLNGRIRKNSPLGSYEIEVLNNFKKFTCVGLYNISENSYTQYVPIYRCYNKKGNYFDYICLMWGEIKVTQLGDLDGCMIRHTQPEFDYIRTTRPQKENLLKEKNIENIISICHIIKYKR